MRNKFTKVTAAIVCIALAVGVGCEQSPYVLAPVRGTVTIDGQPLSRAKVMFAPVEVANNPNPGKPAFGILKDDGSFVLTTCEKDDGAVVGEHWLTIIKLGGKSGGATLVSNLPKSAPQFSRLTMPQRVSVLSGQENQVHLKLTAQDVARYGVEVRD